MNPKGCFLDAFTPVMVLECFDLKDLFQLVNNVIYHHIPRAWSPSFS